MWEIIGKLPEYMGALMGVLSALIAFFMLIPGDAPEKQLQAIVNFIAKFSRK